MKTLFSLSFVLIVSVANFAQNKTIETESITLDNLITFIVENYKVETDSTQTKNSTFLIETYGDSFNTEDKVILKQALKIFSERSNAKDSISIATYSEYNGIALEQAKAIDIKKLLYAIEHPKTSIKKFKNEGIELAYNYTKENYVETAKNMVVIIRVPNRKAKEVTSLNTTTQLKTTKPKSNAVMLTAIALLPEIISVIKD